MQATGISAADYAKHHDSAWIAFTKGLGCPVGAVLAGSEEFIKRAWLFKRRWGGAMRQTGVLAAMCLYALDNNVERLREDHAMAKSIGERLVGLPAIGKVLPVETNIVMIELSDVMANARECAQALKNAGVEVTPVGHDRLRIVTHMDVSMDGVDVLVSAIAALRPVGKK